MNKIQIYIPNIEVSGPSVNILIDGIHDHKQLELVDDENKADYIFLDFRHAQLNLKFNKKKIMIDYSDQQNKISKDTMLLDFKGKGGGG